MHFLKSETFQIQIPSKDGWKSIIHPNTIVGFGLHTRLYTSESRARTYANAQVHVKVHGGKSLR